MLRVTFKKGPGMGGGEEHEDFLWAYYGRSVFYSSHAKKGRKGLCEVHFTSLEHTLNYFTSELSVNYFSEC